MGVLGQIDLGRGPIKPKCSFQNAEMMACQVTDEVLYTGLIEMQELDASG